MSDTDSRWGNPEHMIIAICVEKPTRIDEIKEGLFGDERALAIYRALKALRASRRAWQPSEAEGHIWRLEKTLGSVLTGWLNDLPSPEGWDYWMEIAREQASKRHARELGNRLMEAPDGDLTPYVRQLSKIEEARHKVSAPGIRSVVDDTISELEAEWEQEKDIPGISTGYKRLDSATGGLGDKQLWVIGARPSVGKTTLACNMAASVCVHEKVPVAFFSLEMARTDISRKMAFLMGGLSQTAFKRKHFSQFDFAKLTGELASIKASPLHIIDDQPTLPQVCATVRSLASEHGVKVVILDYLQRLKLGEPLRDRWQEIAEVSNGLKNLAMETGVCVLALAQLSRDVEKEDRKPSLSDLRGSAEIEADADVVGFLHRANDGKYSLMLGKVRRGTLETIDLNANLDTGRITEQELAP